MTAFDDAWGFMKAMKPHRQKVLPEGADSHMRLQQWANRHPTTKEAFASGGDEARTAHRDNLMREAVADPSAHGLMFVGGEPIPFDEEERQSTLEEFTKMVNTRSSGGPRQPASFRRRMKNPTTTAGAPAATPQTQEPQGQFLEQQAVRADKGRVSDMERLKRTDPEAYQKLLLEQQYAPDERLNQTRLLDFVGKMNVYKQDYNNSSGTPPWGPPNGGRGGQPSPYGQGGHPYDDYNPPGGGRSSRDICGTCGGSGVNKNTYYHGRPPPCDACGGTGKRQQNNPWKNRPMPPPGDPQPQPQPNPYGPPSPPNGPGPGPGPIGPGPGPGPNGRHGDPNKSKCKQCGKEINMQNMHPMERYNFKGLCPECERGGGGKPSPYNPGGPPPPPTPQPYERTHPSAPAPPQQRPVGVTPRYHG